MNISKPDLALAVGTLFFAVGTLVLAAYNTGRERRNAVCEENAAVVERLKSQHRDNETALLEINAQIDQCKSDAKFGRFMRMVAEDNDTRVCIRTCLESWKGPGDDQ
jgi:hypothetical protein